MNRLHSVGPESDAKRHGQEEVSWQIITEMSLQGVWPETWRFLDPRTRENRMYTNVQLGLVSAEQHSRCLGTCD